MPSLSLGMVSLELLNLRRDVPQMKSVHAFWYIEKNAVGSFIGTFCSRYRILGRMLILRIAALPNQEKSPDGHDFRSSIILCISVR